MPVANICVLEGHPRPVLKQLVREVSQAYARVTGSPIERVQAWITEVDPELYAIAGVSADEALARGERRDLEIPLVRLVLMEGRPVEQVHECIAVVTEVVGRVLGSDPKRVRVHVTRADPDHWGIGGVPASVLRRDEIEARERAPLAVSPLRVVGGMPRGRVGNRQRPLLASAGGPRFAASGFPDRRDALHDKGQSPVIALPGGSQTSRNHVPPSMSRSYARLRPMASPMMGL